MNWKQIAVLALALGAVKIVNEYRMTRSYIGQQMALERIAFQLETMNEMTWPGLSGREIVRR